MRKRGKARRHILLFILALLTLAGLIVAASLTRIDPESVFPPESPELTAKRQSPDNAFHALNTVALLLPLN